MKHNILERLVHFKT